jgi:carboxylesterase
MTDPVTKMLKKAKSILFADPKLLYKEELHLINQPFFFDESKNKVVLLIHGWSSTPYEVRRLGLFLHENGYAVRAPMIRGHGTVPKDLEGVKWEDWLRDLEIEYAKLRRVYAKVYVGGTSIGANLAIMLAQKNPEISGIVLMAAPYKIKFEKLAYLTAKIHLKFKKYNKKFYPPTFGLATTITRIISYQTYPVESALESFDLVRESREHLNEITQPCFILQSTHDHLIAKNSAEIIYNKISSQIKKIKHIERAYHTFISDIKNEHVFEDILNFLNEN